MSQPMDANSMYYNISLEVFSCGNLSLENKRFLNELLRNSERETEYSKPMPWIGMVIAVASLICTLAMIADYLRMFKYIRLLYSNKYFTLNMIKSVRVLYSCKYFTLNPASLTVIAVAMKLPVDLTTPMLGEADQAAKIGSMAFLCIMMGHLLPSLATMNSKELLANMIALGILVITLIGNVCIQIYTGVIGSDSADTNYFEFKEIALFYAAMLLIMLIIHICSALTLLKSKQIIELKYQASHETALKDLELQQPGRLTAEMLKQHVKNYWIMAVTGSPQFITTSSATTIASWLICVTINNMHMSIATPFISKYSDHQSDYNWSITVILTIQFFGIAVGAPAQLVTIVSVLESFKISVERIRFIIEVFKVDSYSTQKLYDWKQSSIPFSVRSRKTKIFIHKMKVIFLIICIGLQKTVVVACKLIVLIPNFYMICLFFSDRCIRSIGYRLYCAVTGQISGQQENFKDLRRYVLQIRDDMELSEEMLARFSSTVNSLIEEAGKQQPCNLVKLLRESKGFEGVVKYDSLHVPPLFAEDFLDCWSLPLVTLTAIAVSLPKIENDIVDRLLSSVSEGLTYVTLVEESLNAAEEYVNIQKAAKALWLEVEVSNKWLGYNLKTHAPEVNAGSILQSLKNSAKHMVTEMQVIDIRSANDNSINRSIICANSMYRITESILLSYRANINELSQDDLFTELLSMIADIMAACLTNLPQVIVTKCHEPVIEKRESSVLATVKLLGETTQMINNLQDRELPDLDPAELPFIDKWRDYFNYASP